MGLVFVDLKKAFDTVYHQVTYLKLKHYGRKKERLVSVWPSG